MKRDFVVKKEELRKALKEKGIFDKSKEPLIGIAAGLGVLYDRLVKDVERLDSPVIRDCEDFDFVATPDEAVKLLPKAAKDYHNALVALGLADNVIEDPKPGRPSTAQPTSDNDELAMLMNKTVNND